MNFWTILVLTIAALLVIGRIFGLIELVVNQKFLAKHLKEIAELKAVEIIDNDYDDEENKE